MSRLRIGDRVRVIRGLHFGAVGTVEDIGTKVIAVRIPAPEDWPFPSLIGFARNELIVVEDDTSDVGEALL